MMEPDRASPGFLFSFDIVYIACSTPLDKEELKQKILEEIDDTFYDREYLPHVGLIPDWYLRYKDLVLICKYFDEA